MIKTRKADKIYKEIKNIIFKFLRNSYSKVDMKERKYYITILYEQGRPSVYRYETSMEILF